jgi:hypothetical protein
MGYSCTQDADNMLGLIRHTFSNGKYSNGLVIGGRSYFYEIGREHADGHVTGTLFENIDETHARSAGHFSILSDGQITRFPRLKRNQIVSLFFKFAELKRSNPSLLNSYSHGAI